IPQTVGRWNKAGLNRVTKHIAPWLPGFGVVVHRGRRSGRRYQTPVMVFRAGERYVIALTYDPGTAWVNNHRAVGRCYLQTRGQTSRLTSPKVYRDQSRRHIRPLERQVLSVIGVADFLSLSKASAAAATPGQS